MAKQNTPKTEETVEELKAQLASLENTLKDKDAELTRLTQENASNSNHGALTKVLDDGRIVTIGCPRVVIKGEEGGQTLQLIKQTENGRAVDVEALMRYLNVNPKGGAFIKVEGEAKVEEPLKEEA